MLRPSLTELKVRKMRFKSANPPWNSYNLDLGSHYCWQKCLRELRGKSVGSVQYPSNCGPIAANQLSHWHLGPARQSLHPLPLAKQRIGSCGLRGGKHMASRCARSRCELNRRPSWLGLSATDEGLARVAGGELSVAQRAWAGATREELARAACVSALLSHAGKTIRKKNRMNYFSLCNGWE
jgi:hypothetical protein